MIKKISCTQTVKMLKFVFAFLLLVGVTLPINAPSAVAAGNLIKEGSFETDITKYWGVWQSDETKRTYEFYRAYDAPFGYGSYSAVIKADGSPDDLFTAIMTGNPLTNKFSVSSGQNYYLSFYARATKDTDIVAYLETASDYNAVTEYGARTITNEWKKYLISLKPNTSADAILAIVYGDMPDGAELYFDGIQLLEADSAMNTAEVKGLINDSKFLSISNVSYFQEDDIKIELPYYDNLTAKAGTKKFAPTKLVSGGVYFTLAPQTFAGIGKVYINDSYIGSFNYNVQPRIESFNPSLVRVGEDTVVVGSGFTPLTKDNTFLIIDAIDTEGKLAQKWVKPTTCDAELSRLSFRLPAGTVTGKMLIQTAFINTEGTETVNKSNSLAYLLKPVITATEWSLKGYEQVGDKLTISGKGLGKNPRINFYDALGVKLETRPASVLSVGDVERIEVVTTKKDNSFNITVISDGIESDKNDSLSYVAKPRIKSLNTKYSRVLYVGSDKLSAAKIGDTIVFSGEGLKTGGAEIYAEFQGNGKRIRVAIASSEVNSTGALVTTTVPVGTQNGYVNLEINGQDSNYLPLEIVPSIISIAPDPIVPGGDIQITASGMGDNVNLAKVLFMLNGSVSEEVAPYAIDLSGTDAVIYVKTPLAMSSDGTKITLQYDHWSDNGTSVLNVRPHVDSASINVDSKVLSIKGYGFSINPKENIITYKYADANKTAISPKVRMLGVYPTEEGQEIRLQILDNYYYGWISVQVGEYSSNEVNFGPTSIQSVARRIEYVESEGKVTGVLYISGYNFGTSGTVKVGNQTAKEHYRSEFMIIAVIDQAHLYDNPVVVTRN